MTTQVAAREITPAEAANRLYEIATSYVRSQMFFAACRLGVFDQLADGARTAAELAQRLNIHPEICRRLLVGLRQNGLVERRQDRYSNSPLAHYLTQNAAVNLKPVALIGEPFYHMTEFLTDALRENSPRWVQALGTTQQETFAALYEDPQRLRRFCDLLYAFSAAHGAVLAELFDCRPYKCVLDVGGGPGAIAIALGLKYPHLRGIVMDLPAVCGMADERIQAARLSDRFRTEAADLFAGPYPNGADLITLGSVLHDWSDESCRKILRQCFDALPSGGALLLIEIVLNEDYSGTPSAIHSDLTMVVVCEPGARERTEAEYRALLAEAGFRAEKLIRMASPRDTIIARKP